jgi:hypothetical protein
MSVVMDVVLSWSIVLTDRFRHSGSGRDPFRPPVSCGGIATAETTL